MASEILNKQATVENYIPTLPEMTTFKPVIIYNPDNVNALTKVKNAAKKVLNNIDRYPVETFLGFSAVACITVITGGTALPVMAVCAIAVALW